MASGGFRPNAGRPKGSGAAASCPEDADDFTPDIGDDASPLDYMLAVMRSAEVDPNRRDRMAIAAAPFVHARAADKKPTKKEAAAESAQAAVTGRFGVRQPPKLVTG